MGHTRLGWVPKTRKWAVVVDQVASIAPGRSSSTAILSENIAAIALMTLQAAEQGLETAISDKRLTHVFYLLTQIVMSSREDNWQESLSDLGISLAKDASCFDLVTEFHTASDARMVEESHSSDIGEIAQKSAGETLAELVAPRAKTLFGGGQEVLQGAVSEFSTKSGFSTLGQKFFGKFLTHYLNFYLSRITASQAGGRQLPQIGDLSTFNQALETHCEQSAAIVRDFCGGWVSKTSYETGITPENTSRFLAVALRKLKSELQQQEIER